MIRIKIANKWLDLFTGTKLSLQWTSSLFAFDKLQTSRSQQFSIPKTANNDDIFQFSGRLDRPGDFMRTSHKAELHYSGGFINGELYAESSSKDTYECVFIFGELLGLKALKDVGKFREFSKTTLSLRLDNSIVKPTSTPDYFQLYNYRNPYFDNYKNVYNLNTYPSVSVYHMFSEITSVFGVKFDFGDVSDYIRRLVIKLGGLNSTYGDLEDIILYGEQPTTGFFKLVDKQLPIVKEENGEYSWSEKLFTNIWEATTKCTVYFDDDEPNFQVYKILKNGNGFPQTIPPFQVPWNPAYSGVYYLSGDEYDMLAGWKGIAPPSFPNGGKVEFNEGDCLLICSRDAYVDSVYNEKEDTEQYFFWFTDKMKSKYPDNLRLRIVSPANSDTEFAPSLNEYVYLKGNFPDISPMELIKMCACLSGKYLSYNASTNTIVFTDLSFDRSNSIIIDDILLSQKEIKRTVSGFAKKNTILFNYDDPYSAKRDYKIIYSINNSTIEVSKELVNIPFGTGGFLNWLTKKGDAVIADLTYEGKQLASNDILCDCKSGYEYMQAIFAITDNNLQSIFDNSTTVNVTIIMPLYQFILLEDKQVYSYKGCLFCALSAKWSNNTCELELVKI